ncbi:hypothetical protein ACR6C2_01385 [Streptomyces sp. INA 01156]
MSLLIDHFRDRTHEETIISAIRKTLTATAVVGAVLAGSAACGTAEQLSAARSSTRPSSSSARRRRSLSSSTWTPTSRL